MFAYQANNMDYQSRIVTEMELLSVDGIRTCFANGVTPNDQFKNKPLIYELISEYGRGPQFSKCVRLFIEYGLDFPDKSLLAVLADDSNALQQEFESNAQCLSHRYTLDCAFTAMHDVTLLHICAEFNHLSCGALLLRLGVDVNARAGVDKNGFGLQTPVFHTVNQHDNKCADMMQLLITHGADLMYTVEGLIWGDGYDWESFIPAVNPISYAMMGLLPQFQRKQLQVYEMVYLLMKSAYGKEYRPRNLPNKYLAS